MTIVDERKLFEDWISSPPYEANISRYPADPRYSAWPGDYRDITTQLAWRAWRERSLMAIKPNTRTEEDE